ncbi:MAG TPA: GWxTD domain-containing protein [Candidatus Kapabacteria bacterium]|nr:GWxTD domain-containing protein [Candidatus Kapabacteria bacterium]
MNRTTLLLLRLLVPALLAGLPTMPLAAQPTPLGLAVSHSCFAYNDSAAAVEFDIQFSGNALTFRQEKDGTIGRLYARLAFVPEKAGSEPLEVDWVTAVPKSVATEAMGTVRSVELAPGNYTATLYAADMAEKTHADSVQFTVAVPSFAGHSLKLSDVQFVADAVPSEETSNPYFKNGYVITPVVVPEMGPPLLSLNTYIEVYNADAVMSPEVHLSYKLANRNKVIFYERQVTLPKTGNRSTVDIQAFPLDSMPSGEYFVLVRAYNDAERMHAKDSVSVYRAFSISNPAYDSTIAPALPAAAPRKQPVTEIIDPIYAGMKEPELDEEYAKVRYIASEPEKRLWEGLSGVDAKARFLTAFWGARDATPGTPENEERDSYYKRVEQARSLYSAPMTPKGWDSDRGRVLLQYGKPDNVDRHYQDFNRKPYEIWTYSGLNYTFVFLDRPQTGLYKLVHSTAPSEIHYENWETDYAPLSKNWNDQ